MGTSRTFGRRRASLRGRAQKRYSHADKVCEGPLTAGGVTVYESRNGRLWRGRSGEFWYRIEYVKRNLQ